uniref:Apple domain-containing protein n=1 Tax=Nelumbo nucifera TaxID=4432 RepID=A0A822Z126_NELNU|nr:TPA_asm: hypothetical protein HUJ06_014427 [Nelumbo nucifera]
MYFASNNSPQPLPYYAYQEFGTGQDSLTYVRFNDSMLRLGSDGNLKIYTYYDKLFWFSWDVTFTLFDRDGRESECKLPTRCGSFGVCEDNQCVACPTPQGLSWWNKGCAPPKLPPCKAGANINYYRIEGVEHFSSEYSEGDGPVKVADCRAKCDRDCGCLGFFYRAQNPQNACWLLNLEL